MRKAQIAFRKLLGPILHPAEFIRYVANFEEWFQGRAEALRMTVAAKASPAGSPGTLDPSRNSLIDFYLNGSHRGMTKPIHFLEAYLPHFAEMRERGRVRLLEIGVFSGGSLEMYRQFFTGTDLHIVGVDIDADCRDFAAADTRIELGDQEDRGFWRRFKGQHEPFDVIVDDGGHTCEQQIVTFESMFDMVTPGGVYIIEDIGGSTHGRFLAYVTGLMTAYNYTPPAPQPVHRDIRSIECIPGCIIIRKRADPAALEFRGPWVGNSWTKAASALYARYNDGRSPPTVR